MSEDWHTIDTGNEIIVRPMFFGSRRPKIWLRRCPESARRAVRDYILNRRSEAQIAALENLRRVLGSLA